MSRSQNKKIIPIIIVAVVAIGAFAIIFNSDSIENQNKEIEQTNISEKIEESIQEIKNVSQPETPLSSKLESNQNPSQLRAAIIDQLHDEIPNYELQEDATRILEGAGYQVDLYTTKVITVEFYKKLPSMNYNFILIRTHGGEGDPDDKYPTILFTGEKYDAGKYTLDQISGQIGRGFPFYEENLNELKERGEDPHNQEYFTIGPKLVKEGMVGTFPDSIIIVGGCQSARSHDLMESLMDRGASHVIGWDATVGSRDNDTAITLLLEDILENKVSLYDAVYKINSELIEDFKYPSKLQLFNAI